MNDVELAWPFRLLIAALFCGLVVYGIGVHALPWALNRLPLGAIPAVVFTVVLVSILWATVDIVRASLPFGR